MDGLFDAGSGDWNESHFARAVLERFVDFSKMFGFSGIVILVDKVDETDEISNSGISSAHLLWPILSSTQLLEVDGLGCIMLLWDRVKEEYNESDMPARLDKIANADINWPSIYLVNLIEEMIKFFSDNNTTSLSALFEDEDVGKRTMEELISASVRSPRELIRLLDTLIREHDEIHAADEPCPLLDLQSVERALDRYSIDAVRRILSKSYIQQIKKVGKLSFINRDIQQALKVNTQTARSRINSWADEGIVAQTGSRPAEGGTGGKPAHEYSVIDYRVRRLLERSLSPGAEYEYPDADESVEEHQS